MGVGLPVAVAGVVYLPVAVAGLLLVAVAVRVADLLTAADLPKVVSPRAVVGLPTAAAVRLPAVVAAVG